MQRAFVWYSLAAKGGNEKAQTQLDTITLVMTTNQLSESQQLLEQWHPGQCERNIFRNSLSVTPDTDSETAPVN